MKVQQIKMAGEYLWAVTQAVMLQAVSFQYVVFSIVVMVGLLNLFEFPAPFSKLLLSQ
jgi:hypothetical protein